MREFEELLNNPEDMVKALTAVLPSLSGRQYEHLEVLYRCSNGQLAQRDVRNRVQSETRNSCSRIGGQLSRFFGCNGPRDKMMWIGHVEQDRNGDERWVMRPQIRATLIRLKTFGPDPFSESSMTWSSSNGTLVSTSQVEMEQREARFVLVEMRPAQAAFRRSVFRASGGACVVSGCPVPEALEAAHVEGRNWRQGENSAEDGILLRRDLHALYDSGLLSINALGKVDVDQSVIQTYGEFQDIQILAGATYTRVGDQANASEK